MHHKHNTKEQSTKILEDHGGKVADKAKTILLEDPALKELRQPLEFISKHWRDPLTPALMALSCEVVGGNPEDTHETALAMSLINLSFHIWDDIIDKASLKLFKPTLFGKFGEATTLIIGGLSAAKAFTILNQMNFEKTKHQTITNLFWKLCAKMAQAETVNLKTRSQQKLTSREKLWKIKTEATADLETCLKIGAIIGNGSENEIKHLGKYGYYLGIILELWKEFHISVNLTSELAEKIRTGAMPYPFLWAMEHSEKIRKKLDALSNKKTIEQVCIKEIVEDFLETKAYDNTVKAIRRFIKKAKEELKETNENDAVRTLQSFIEAQSQCFVESIPTLQACER
jgi:geranylgeranyl pyrophosphate synthase